MHRRLYYIATSCLVLTALPAAQAHLVTTGLGPIYDGMGHFLLSPDNVGTAVALALFVGLRGPTAGRRTSVLLPAVWFVAGLIGTGLPSSATLEAVFPAASLIVVGILLAADRPLPAPAIAALVFLVGAANGFCNGSAMAEIGFPSSTLQLLGVALMLLVLSTLGAAVALALRATVFRYVIRVAGSWSAATGLLLLGWYFRARR